MKLAFVSVHINTTVTGHHLIKFYFLSRKQELRGETWVFSDKAIIFVNGEFLGGPSEFLKWAEQEHNYENFRPNALYQTLAEEAYKNHLNTQQVIYD